jgi:hypothetical protein
MRWINGQIAVVASGLLTVTGTGLAAAAEPGRTMAAVEQRLEPGTEVEVVDRAGHLIQGQFVRADVDGVVVDLYGNEERHVPAADVVSVDKVGDSLANGILIGLASGAVVGGYFALTPSVERFSCWDDICGPWCVDDACRWITGAAVTAAGVALGAYLDHRKTGRTAVYRSPVRRASLSVTPQLVRRGAGLKVAVRF